jgi:hypothetical protein
MPELTILERLRERQLVRRALDPLSPYINVNLCSFLYVAGDYQGAVDHYDRVLGIFPITPSSTPSLGSPASNRGGSPKPSPTWSEPASRRKMPRCSLWLSWETRTGWRGGRGAPGGFLSGSRSSEK